MQDDAIGVSADLGLGARIGVIRRRRGMARAAVAGLCGRSEEWLRQIERGKRGTSLKMLVRLADVLKVKDLAELLGPTAPTALYAHPEHAGLDAVRRAVTEYGTGDTAPPPDVNTLGSRVAHAWQRRSVSSRDRTDLAAVLPALLSGAQHAARTAVGATQRRQAYRLLAEVYHLGQLYLCYQDAPELLWVVVDRGMNAALESEDPATLGRAAWFTAYLYRDFGVVDQAHQVVDDALRRLQAADETPELNRQRVVVHLASAWNHARDGHPADAWRAWDAAVDADRDADRRQSPLDLFGTTCSDVALVLDVELGRTASAVRRAEATDVDQIAGVPRRARLMIEIARGYRLKREHAGALHLLRRAHEVSAEATLFSMYARSMVHELLTDAGPMLRPDAIVLANKLGIAA